MVPVRTEVSNSIKVSVNKFMDTESCKNMSSIDVEDTESSKNVSTVSECSKNKKSYQ